MHRLDTERLTLRRFTPADSAALLALHGDPEVMRFVGNGPVPGDAVRRDTLPLLLADHARSDGLGFFAAHSRTDGAFVGWFQLRPLRDEAIDDVELGYRLHVPFWGAGLATEGAKALLDHGFGRVGIHRVFATTMAVNHASRRVLEKLGLRFARTFFDDWPTPLPGAEHGDVEYALTHAEWAASKA